MKSNADLQKNVQDAIRWEPWVTLDGELEWNFQKEAARNAVSNLLGVAGVTNNITIIAWMVRGVWSVENDLVVDYAYELID